MDTTPTVAFLFLILFQSTLKNGCGHPIALPHEPSTSVTVSVELHHKFSELEAQQQEIFAQEELDLVALLKNLDDILKVLYQIQRESSATTDSIDIAAPAVNTSFNSQTLSAYIDLFKQMKGIHERYQLAADQNGGIIEVAKLYKDFVPILKKQQELEKQINNVARATSGLLSESEQTATGNNSGSIGFQMIQKAKALVEIQQSLSAQWESGEFFKFEETLENLNQQFIELLNERNELTRSGYLWKGDDLVSFLKEYSKAASWYQKTEQDFRNLFNFKKVSNQTNAISGVSPESELTAPIPAPVNTTVNTSDQDSIGLQMIQKAKALVEIQQRFKTHFESGEVLKFEETLAIFQQQLLELNKAIDELDKIGYRWKSDERLTFTKEFSKPLLWLKENEKAIRNFSTSKVFNNETNNISGASLETEKPTTAASTPVNTSASQFSISEELDGRCLEGPPGPVILATCSKTAQQTWTLQSGWLRNLKSNFCLTVESEWEEDVLMEECDIKNSRQVWTKVGKSIISVGGRCLTVGLTKVGVAACGEKGFPQEIRLSAVRSIVPDKEPERYPLSFRRLRNRSVRRKCLVAATKDRTWSVTCSGSPAEEWYHMPDESIRNRWNNLCLDGRDEELVTTEECDSSKSQIWQPILFNRLINNQTGNCLQAGHYYAYTASCVLDNHYQQFKQW